MRVQVMSDLHLEHHPFTLKAAKGADVCILAGDLCEPAALPRLQSMLRGWTMPTIIVLGNHDFYGDTVTPELKGGSLAELVDSLPKNFHLLDNDALDIEGVRFVGGTLWTDFELHDSAVLDRMTARLAIPDFNRILVNEPGFATRLMLSDDMIASHGKCLEAIEEARTVHDKVVVVTHFLPSPASIHPRYARHPLNSYFCTDLQYLMGSPISLWIHGHTHSPADYVCNGTRVVCNPRGYPGHENRDFTTQFLIEI